ncbi:hypothetical protein GCM10022220_62050 [Actinocatenispora rupis]|uniref:Uncharacterized protein n=1 Tax=Actinocatenispora rupis TaxID=519421 RepID=A0A8J3NG02_9ACTN|nr:hypothetical protein Aru02nite_63290 [Actinocatenispora rupis]
MRSTGGHRGIAADHHPAVPERSCDPPTPPVPRVCGARERQPIRNRCRTAGIPSTTDVPDIDRAPTGVRGKAVRDGRNAAIGRIPRRGAGYGARE